MILGSRMRSSPRGGEARWRTGDCTLLVELPQADSDCDSRLEVLKLERAGRLDSIDRRRTGGEGRRFELHVLLERCLGVAPARKPSGGGLGRGFGTRPDCSALVGGDGRCVH